MAKKLNGPKPKTTGKPSLQKASEKPKPRTLKFKPGTEMAEIIK